MRIDKFKELLIKKAGDNRSLQTLIKYARDEYLLENIIESLEKMARISQHRNANFAVKNFGSEIDPELHPNMFHDALSHHASQYKSALKNKNNDVANQHAGQIFKYMHLLHKLTDDGGIDHTGGHLKVDAIDPKPWERSHYSEENGRSSSTNTKGWARSMKDYSWLQSAPHHSYKKEVKTHGHNGAYPLEQIKVNDKYLHIDDIDESTGKYEPHPLDHHPILSHYKKPSKDFSEDHYNDYLSSVDKYHDEDGHMDAYFDKHEALSQKDPEAYSARGSKVSDPVHDPHPTPLSLEDEIAEAVSEDKPTAEPAADVKPNVKGIDLSKLPPDLIAKLKEGGHI